MGKGDCFRLEDILVTNTNYNNGCCWNPDSNKINVKHFGDSQGNLNVDWLLDNTNKLLLFLLTMVIMIAWLYKKTFIIFRDACRNMVG